MWENTFSKAFKNPFVKNMVFILFHFFSLSFYISFFYSDLALSPSWRREEGIFKGDP